MMPVSRSSQNPPTASNSARRANTVEMVIQQWSNSGSKIQPVAGTAPAPCRTPTGRERSSMTSQRVWHIGTSGCAAMKAICFASFSGYQTSSESRNATNSPRAARAAWLRVTGHMPELVSRWISRMAAP